MSIWDFSIYFIIFSAFFGKPSIYTNIAWSSYDNVCFII